MIQGGFLALDMGGEEQAVPLREDIDHLIQWRGSEPRVDDETLRLAQVLETHRGGLSRFAAVSSEARAAIIRFGCAAGLGFIHILALLLKAQKEQAGMGAPQNSAMGKACLSQADIREIYESLEQTNGLARKAGYPWPQFETLAQEMLLAGMHRVANHGLELKAFAEREHEATRILREGTPEQQDAYWVLKTQWLHLQENLGNCLALLERRRLENAAIKRDWMAEFGREYVEMQGQLKRLEGLKLRRDILAADPDISAEELERLVGQAEEERNKALERLRQEWAHATAHRRDQPGTAMSDDQFQEYKKQYKQVLRRIWLTIHPDQLQNNPAYGRLTERQQGYLRQLWQELMEIRPEETGYHKEQIGYSYRDMEKLVEISATAQTILANAGIDTQYWLIIQGETLAQQLEWLERTSRSLERQIDLSKLELRVLLEDKAMREKMAMLESSGAQHELIKKEMLAFAGKYQEEGDQIQGMIAGHFAKEV